jgi:hypothetical protein
MSSPGPSDVGDEDLKEDANYHVIVASEHPVLAALTGDELVMHGGNRVVLVFLCWVGVGACQALCSTKRRSSAAEGATRSYKEVRLRKQKPVWERGLRIF